MFSVEAPAGLCISEHFLVLASSFSDIILFRDSYRVFFLGRRVGGGGGGGGGGCVCVWVGGEWG